MSSRKDTRKIEEEDSLPPNPGLNLNTKEENLDSMQPADQFQAEPGAEESGTAQQPRVKRREQEQADEQSSAEEIGQEDDEDRQVQDESEGIAANPDNDNQIAENDEEEKQSTFVTETETKKPAAFVQPFTTNDLLFPGGKVSKLCRIANHRSKDINVGDILKKLDIKEWNPVIWLLGCQDDSMARVISPLVRVAHMTDAVIIDHGLASGIEGLAIKRGVKIVGICPETQIKYPTKPIPGQVNIGELTPHTHLITLGSKQTPCKWQDIAPFKLDVANRIRRGRGGPNDFNCKGVAIWAGNAEISAHDMTALVQDQWNIVVLDETDAGKSMATGEEPSSNVPPELMHPDSKVRIFEGSGDQLVGLIHAYLTLTV